MKCLILIAFLACVGSALAVQRGGKVNVTDLNSLSVPEKLGLLAVSTVQPERFGKLTWSSLFYEDDLPWIDYFFVDIRNLLIQSIKVQENIPLPELDWSWVLEYCIIYCYKYEFILESNNTKMTGQKGTTSVNEITPTSFKNSFRAPSFVWDSPDLSFKIIEDDYYEYSYKDMRVAINNLRFETAFNYEYVEGIGIQVSNLTIDFSINYLRIIISKVKQGSTILPPIFTDWTFYLRSGWSDYKADYQSSIQFKLNCVLSDSRNDPERCALHGWVGTGDYYRLNVVQLIETIGLGSLNRA